VTAQTSAQTSIINAFLQLVAAKTPYVYGGVTKAGADCSGAVKWAFATAGFTFGARTAAQQALLGTAVPLTGANLLWSADPGDILIFSEPGEGPDSHEALYAGGGLDYEESHTGTDAREIGVDTPHLVAIRRLVSSTGTALAGVNGQAVNVPGSSSTPTSTPAKKSSSKSWTTIAAEVLAVAAAGGIIILGAYRTAAPTS
jgi:hypothetical protein